MVKMIMLFWLKEGESVEEAKDPVKAAVSLMKNIPAVKGLDFGTSSDFGDHVIDNSFDFGAILTFDTMEDFPTIMHADEHMQMAGGLKVYVEKMQAFILNC